MPYLKAVLFDIDEMLVDSNDAHAHAWMKAFAETGIRSPHAHPAYHVSTRTPHA